MTSINFALRSRKSYTSYLLFGLLLCFPQLCFSQNEEGQTLGSLENPSEKLQMKEQTLIEEILAPELIFRIDPAQSKIVRTKLPIARFAVTNQSVIEINEFGDTEIEVVGLKNGQTTLTFWFDQKDERTEILRYLVIVGDEGGPHQAVDLQKLQANINESFSECNVKLIPIADKLIVQGLAANAKQEKEILKSLRDQLSLKDFDHTSPQSSSGKRTLDASASIVNLIQIRRDFLQTGQPETGVETATEHRQPNRISETVRLAAENAPEKFEDNTMPGSNLTSKPEALEQFPAQQQALNDSRQSTCDCEKCRHRSVRRFSGSFGFSN